MNLQELIKDKEVHKHFRKKVNIIDYIENMDTKIVMILAMIEMKISYQIKEKLGKQINFATRDNIQIK